MSEKKGAFITIGGIDGTGKTTTTALTTDLFLQYGLPALNYDLYQEGQVNPFARAKASVVSETSPFAQYAYFLGSTLYHSEQIKLLLNRGISVVKSRYLDDVIAHHLHLGVSNAEEIAAMFPILEPDLKVILTLSEDERRRRILLRGEKDVKDQEVRKPGSRLDFFEKYLLSRAKGCVSVPKSLVLDTGIHVPKTIARQVLEVASERGLIGPIRL